MLMVEIQNPEAVSATSRKQPAAPTQLHAPDPPKVTHIPPSLSTIKTGQVITTSNTQTPTSPHRLPPGSYDRQLLDLK